MTHDYVEKSDESTLFMKIPRLVGSRDAEVLSTCQGLQ